MRPGGGRRFMRRGRTTFTERRSMCLSKTAAVAQPLFGISGQPRLRCSPAKKMSGALSFWPGRCSSTSKGRSNGGGETSLESSRQRLISSSRWEGRSTAKVQKRGTAGVLTWSVFQAGRAKSGAFEVRSFATLRCVTQDQTLLATFGDVKIPLFF